MQDRKISYTLRKPYDYIKSLNKKIPSKTEGIAIGEPDSKEFAQKSVININFFLSHREEVLAMKEQVQMIKGLLAA